jgi:GNAT superfamily N-acetyltransferase
MAVAGVHVRSRQKAYRALLPDQYLDELRPVDRAARYSFGDDEPDRPVSVVALDHDVVRGFATIGPSRDTDGQRSGELFALYVDPDSWGFGIRRALMKEARDRLTQLGFEVAILWVLVGNERAEHFYRGDGWLLDGARRLDEVHAVTVDEVRYHRVLQ